MFDLDRNIFFSHVRDAPFPGRLSRSQVKGMEHLLDAWQRLGTDNTAALAYTLATDYHETGGRMQPVREGFASSDKEARRLVKKYNRSYAEPEGPRDHVYYGRGDVQLTWIDNYRRMGELLGIPLVKEPDLALEPDVSKKILVAGMVRGEFTGRKLSDYFKDEDRDPFNARRIVNRMDKAALIEGYYHEFLEAVESAVAAASKADEPDPTPEVKPRRMPPKNDSISWGAVLSGGGGLLGGVNALMKEIDNPWTLGALAIVAVGVFLVLRGRLRIVNEAGF